MGHLHIHVHKTRDNAKLSKESVHYGKGKGEDRCRNCVHYQGDGACALVAGMISPDGWCEKFKKDRAAATRDFFGKLRGRCSCDD